MKYIQQYAEKQVSFFQNIWTELVDRYVDDYEINFKNNYVILNPSIVHMFNFLSFETQATVVRFASRQFFI